MGNSLTGGNRQWPTIYLTANNCKHTSTSPYHPAPNGLAERFLQPFKQAIQASQKVNSLAHSCRVANFLLHYRNTRHATTEASPAQLMIGWDLRSMLHLLRPDLQRYVLNHQAIQVNSRASAPERNFEAGDSVMARDYRPNHSR